jgi:hypothetical protein
MTKDTYPHVYGVSRDVDGNLTLEFKERFRSITEVEWATAFDRLGLQWEYEPLKFDMGPKHFSYTPDFRVPELATPGSGRTLYIETKWFGETMDLTKYVRFTRWYNCDLLVLAHDEGIARKKDIDVLKPKNKRYFLILKCAQCDSYDWFPCDELPTDDYICSQNTPSAPYILRQNMPYALADKFPSGYRLAAEGTFWLVVEEEPPSFAVLPASAWSEKEQAKFWADKLVFWRAHRGLMPYRHHPIACQAGAFERIVAPNYFLIQAGTIRGERVVLPESTPFQIRYACP